jgi:Kef-type K+ transport system membrane component KefB
MTPSWAPVAPLSPGSLLVLLVQLAVLLLIATGLGKLATRFGLPAVVGELLTGVLLGPSVLGYLAPEVAGWFWPPRDDQAHLLDAVGILGVLLLVAVAGSHLDLAALRGRRGTALRVSLAGLVVPLGLGVCVAYWPTAGILSGHTDQLTFAMFLGVAMCITSVPVIAKTLVDLDLLHRDVGQLILTAGIIDDTVGWFLLSIVAAMATVGLHAGTLAPAMLLLAGFLLVALLVGRPLVAAAIRLAARSTDPGPMVAVTFGAILVCSAIAQAVGAEPIFGAFVAGLLLASCAQDHRARLAPLRTVALSVFAPIFFATVGLRINLTMLADPRVLLVAGIMLAVAILGKFLGAYLGAWLSRLNRWEGLALAAGMNARGVVQIVVGIVGLRLGVINSAGFTVIVTIAIVTSLMAPPILRFATAQIDSSDAERQRNQAWNLADHAS